MIEYLSLSFLFHNISQSFTHVDFMTARDCLSTGFGMTETKEEKGKKGTHDPNKAE